MRDEKKNLPASVVKMVRNLKQAAVTTGTGRGGSGVFMRVDDRTGAVTAGSNRDPVPLKMRYAVNLSSFCHGYLDFRPEGGAERHMVSMAENPVRPTPPGGYAVKFGEAGAKNASEIALQSLDEPGLVLVFTAMGVSNENRLRALLEDVLVHLDTEDGLRGFVHPVIFITPGRYFHQGQGREIFHFSYEITDWMNQAGDLASKTPPVAAAGAAETAPWDDAAA
jgi:hypothetical protein